MVRMGRKGICLEMVFGVRPHARRRGIPLLWLLLALVWICPIGTGRPALAQQGSVTIASTDREPRTYGAYLLFGAETAEGTHASSPSWPSETTRNVVMGVLRTHGYDAWCAQAHPHATDPSAARLAAEFLAQELGGITDGASAASTGNNYNQRLATSLARACVQSDGLTTAQAQAGTTFEAEEGYWLFVSSASEASAGTAPLFVLVSAEERTVEDKASTPSLHAWVLEDSTESWGLTADAHRMQPVSHRIVGTLPRTFSSFDTYHYQIACTLPEGMAVSMPEGATPSDVVALRVGGTTVPPTSGLFTVSLDRGQLVVDIPNLRDASWESYDLDASSLIELVFDAHLTNQASLGAAGNTLTACLTYTSDPIRARDARTAPCSTTVFTYALLLHKEDRETAQALEGAAFCLKAKTPSHTEGTEELYVQADGSLAATPHQFVADGAGNVTIAGIDEGTFVLSERTAPKGYQTLARDAELEVSSTRNDEGQALVSLQATVTSDEVTLGEIDATEGRVQLRVTNARTPDTVTPFHEPPQTAEKVERLAQTGRGPLSLVLIGTGLAIAIASVIRRRGAVGARQDEQHKPQGATSRHRPQPPL